MNRRNFIGTLIGIPVACTIVAKADEVVYRVPQTIGRRPEPKFVLSWGMRGGGKTHAALQTLVRHCRDNRNALAVIVNRTKPIGDHAWRMLEAEILPAWDKSEVSYSETKRDAAGHRFIWVTNRHGESSMILRVDGTGQKLCAKMRGIEPSFLLAPNLDYQTDRDFMAMTAQLGRRPGFIHAPFIGEARPSVGVDHWIYNRWFGDDVDAEFVHRYFGDCGAREVDVVTGKWKARA